MPTVVTMEALKGVIDQAVEQKLGEKLTPVQTELNALNKNISAQKSVEKGLRQARILRAYIETQTKRNAGVSIKNNSVNEEVTEIIRQRYLSEDPTFVDEVIQRNKDLMATGNGGNIIVDTYAGEFLDLLWNNTILDKVGVRFMPTTTGNLTIPKILSGVAAGYVSEGGTIDTSTIKFGRIRLAVKKLMALVPVSNDLLRYAGINVDAIIRDQLIKQLAQVADWAVLYGTGGLYQPLGIANTASILTQAGNQTTVATRAMGLQMVKALGKANHALDGLYWVMGWDTYINLLNETVADVGYVNAAELNNGQWLGYPFVVSNTVKQDATYEDLFLVKFTDFEGIQTPSIQIVPSTEATIVTSEGTLSAFAQDYTIVRAIVEHDFTLAHGNSAVYYKPKIAA